MTFTAGAGLIGRIAGSHKTGLRVLYTLTSLPANTISQLQSVLNAAARLVFFFRKHHRVTSLLQRLRWLNMEQLALLAYRCLRGLAPHISPTNCSLFQLLTHGDDCGQPTPTPLSFRRLFFPPSVIGLSLLPQLGCGTACQFWLHQQQPSTRSSTG